jgi:hypothetical protein
MRSFILLSVVLLVLAGCSNESDPASDKSSFTRIYDNNQFNVSFYPIDIKQTPDGGYMILGGRRIPNSNFFGVYIMKVDEFGGFISELEVDDNLVNPIGPLLESGGNYFFFCMTSVGLQTQLVQLNVDGTLSDPINIGGSYPAAAAADGSNFLLLSYDNFNKLSVVSVITPSGSITRSMGFSIGAGDAVEEPIINHFLHTGKQLPFLVGKTSSGQYYFNGFYNYTLSLAFTNLNDDEPQGIVQGQQDDGGISQVIQLGGSKFALSRFNFGDNYFVPGATLNTSGISSSTDLGGNSLPELAANAPVRIIRITSGTKNIALYGSNTRSDQIALFGYDESSGEFMGSRYLGFSNPFEIASIVSTIDGGLAVCGTTYVAGRFPRICIFKLSKDEVTKSFQ